MTLNILTPNQTFILAGSMLIIALALFGYAGKTAAQIIKENKQIQQAQLESKPVTQATEKTATPNYGAPYPFTAEQLLAQWIEVLELPAEQLTRANVERIFKVKLTEHRIYTNPKGRDEVLVKLARYNEKLAEQLEGKNHEEEIPLIEAWLRQQERSKDFTWPMRPVYYTTPGKDWYFELYFDDFAGEEPPRFSFYFGQSVPLAQHPEMCISWNTFTNALEKLNWIPPFYYKDNRYPRIHITDVKIGDQIIKCIEGFSLEILSEKRLEDLKHVTQKVNKENQTLERKQSMAAFGAELILTPAAGSMEYARDYANQLQAEGKGIVLDQFANWDNPLGHIEQTGPEIWRDTQGSVTHFVSAMGTTGTITGVSNYLKAQQASIQIIGAQPAEGAQIPGIRKWQEAYLPSIYQRAKVDEIKYVEQADAEEMTRRMAREEGIFCGISSGGALWTALEVAKTVENATIVFIVCDRGDRYLSTGVFPA